MATTTKTAAKTTASASAKPAAKKPVTKKKTAAKKKAAPAAPVFEAYCEINGEQVRIDNIKDRVLDAYKADGHRVGNIRDIKTYLNLAERRAYYVINGKAEDKFVEF